MCMCVNEGFYGGLMPNRIACMKPNPEYNPQYDPKNNPNPQPGKHCKDLSGKE